MEKLKRVTEDKYNKILPKINYIYKECDYDKDLLINLAKYPSFDFIDGFKVSFVIPNDKGVYRALTWKDIEEGIDIYKLYDKACENLVLNTNFSIAHTEIGCFKILGDNLNESAAILLKNIWMKCCEGLNDDLLITIPESSCLLFAQANQEMIVNNMLLYSNEIFLNSNNKFCNNVFKFSKDNNELTIKGVLQNYK